jgi:hypothetical protein
MSRAHGTSFVAGLAAAAGGLSALLAPASAQQASRQHRAYVNQGYYGAQNTPSSNVVCWNGCGHPGSIVMGADPDPFIRSQILRDASGFFGGNR